MRILPWALSLSFFAAYALASDTDLAASLLEDISETTQLATQTNQNIDYQPFILSVLHTDDIMKFGAKTLGEALLFVPSVDMTTDNLNNRTPIIRGSNPLAYGQTKLVIDGVVVNNISFDSYNAYLDFPIELIQRIEVVRGSGSFVEGVNGYAGTINVITYASGSSLGSTLFASLGNNQSRTIGGWNLYQGEKWKLATDVFYQTNDLHTPISVQGSSKYGPSPSGFANLSSDHLGLGMSLRTQQLTIQGRVNEYHSGSAFGNFNVLPNEDGTRQNDSWYLQGEYRQSITDDLTLKFKAGIMEDEWASNSLTLPPSTLYPEGYWAMLMLQNRLLHGGITAEYKGFKNHTLTGGYTLKYESAIDLSSVSTDRSDGIGLVDYTDTAPFFNADAAKRHVHEFYLSDTIDINDRWALAITWGGIKSDRSPLYWYGRGSLVYQPSYSHIFKAMIGNSIRLPSWQEMYVGNNPERIGNPELEPEHVTSYEAQYLYKFTPQATMGINLFYLENSNQIVRDANNTFQNYGENTIVGGEAELRGKLTPKDTLSLSYSYIHGTVRDNMGNESPLPYAASHLIKAAYAYDLNDDWSMGGIWNYVGAKKRHDRDTRETLEAYNTLDITLGWNMNTHKGWYAQGIIKNIANTVVRYPATPLTYSDDYPVSDRTCWIRAGWKF
ncbi:MAG: TonB-dependent receptor plug domain-containing protein [Sulfuricurvum sp.]|nr:TonB-dependent receptor plug domain-containing protein [Sulfuricurvum sp.]